MNEFPTTENIVNSILQGRPPKAPYRATIDLTTRCNLQCEFCWFHAPANTRPLRPENASTSKLIAMIKELRDMGTQTICLSGSGDPLNHPSFAEIVDAIKQANMSLTIITNLSASSQKIKAALARADHLMVNLAATSESEYMAIHSPKNPRIFRQVLNNILSLAKYRTQSRPYIEISYVLTKNNFLRIDQAIQAAKSYGASCICFKTLQTTPFSRNLALSRNDKKSLLLNIVRLLKSPLGIRTNLRAVIKTLRPSPESIISSNRCFIGWFNVKIRQDGDVGLCCLNNKLKIGNWKKNTLKQLWHKPKTHRLRLLAQNHIQLKRINDADCLYCPYATINSQIEAELQKHGPCAK